MNSIVNELKQNGVAILKNLYDFRQIESLKQYQILLEYNLNKLLNDEELKSKSHSICRYKSHFDIERINNKNQYNFEFTYHPIRNLVKIDVNDNLNSYDLDKKYSLKDIENFCLKIFT